MKAPRGREMPTVCCCLPLQYTAIFPWASNLTPYLGFGERHCYKRGNTDMKVWKEREAVGGVMLGNGLQFDKISSGAL